MEAATLTAVRLPVSEEELVEKAQAFADDAWGHLYDEFYPRIFAFCYARTGNWTASEDLASDVFLQALRGIERYRYRGVPLSTWLYRIARNLSADFLKRRARRWTEPLGAESQHQQLQAPDRADAFALSQDIQGAIRQLTDDQQQVIILRFFQGLSHEEVATVMERRPGAVRVLQNRALGALRRVMSKRTSEVEP